MNKEKQCRETIDYVQYSCTQSLGEELTRHQLTVGKSRYSKFMGQACESQGNSHAHHRPERHGALGWVLRWSGLTTASYYKPWKINQYQ